MKLTEEKLGFFETMHKSMFDIGYYKTFIDSKLKKSILYIILFGLFIGSLSMIKMTVLFSDYYNSIQTDFNKNVPEFVIEEGTLSTEGGVVFERKNEEFEILINPEVVGTTMKTEALSGIYLTKDSLVVKTPFIYDVIDYKLYGDTIITKLKVSKYLSTIKNASIIGLFLLGTALGMVTKILDSFMVSIVGLIVNKTNKYKMNYKNIYKIGVHALTFPSIVAVIADIFLMNTPLFTIMYFFVIVAYYSRVFRSLTDIPEQD